MGSGEVVLVVEDDELVREVLVRALTESGFQVLPAANGAEALDIAGKPSAAAGCGDHRSGDAGASGAGAGRAAGAVEARGAGAVRVGPCR